MIKQMTSQSSAIQRPNLALPTQVLPVFNAEHFRVHSGANFGDPISHADEIELDDVYRLDEGTERQHLSVNVSEADIQISKTSEIGQAGARVHLDCVTTLMGPDGSTVEALVAVETDLTGVINATYLLPLASLKEKYDYAIVAVDRENARTRLAEVACISFTRQTLITLANGLQKPIEELNVGDRVLTRDNGPREIRWIGQQTVRATGDFAPIVIKKGAMNNEHDLMVSPNHRIFVYQRNNRINAGQAEILIKAKLLVNGVDVVQSSGGFVEYFQLLFDSHEIIYAEGIAAESMFVDTKVKPYLPEAVQAKLAEASGHSTSTNAFELPDGALEPSQAARFLRRSSAS